VRVNRLVFAFGLAGYSAVGAGEVAFAEAHVATSEIGGAHGRFVDRPAAAVSAAVSSAASRFAGEAVALVARVARAGRDVRRTAFRASGRVVSMVAACLTGRARVPIAVVTR